MCHNVVMATEKDVNTTMEIALILKMEIANTMKAITKIAITTKQS
jgi:hypothetical protein